MEGFIRFVGTGGARFVAAQQTRSTGGLWLKYHDTNIYIDPGPARLSGSMLFGSTLNRPVLTA